MKLTLQIKLIPSKAQQQFLLDTFKECNAACNDISKTAWSEKVFNQFKLHSLVYYSIKNSTRLSAQMIIRCISKVVDSYKTDKKKKHAFNLFGAITYDPRILSYKDMIASISTINGRVKIPFICHNEKYLPYIKGEADLVTRNGKFYLLQTVEVPEDDIINVEEFIGVDFGITDIAVLSTGTSFSSKVLNTIRDKKFKTRRSVKICNTCKYIGDRKGKRFNCTRCGNIDDADINAAKNISHLGAIVNCPEKVKNMSCSVSHISLKAISL